MAAPLASPDDLEARLGRALSTEERDAVTALLRDASGTVRLRSTQQFTAGRSTVLVRARGDHSATTSDGETIYGGRARLPQRPVTEIHSVEDELGNAVAFAWTAGDDFVVVAGHGLRVVIDYSHGYPEGEIPDEIVGLVCRMAGRALGTPADEAGLTSETLLGYSYTIGAAAGAGAAGMLDDEVALVESYKRAGGPIRT